MKSKNDILALISRIRHKADVLIIQELNSRNLNGLAPSHGEILYTLFERKQVTMKELAETIDRDKSTVTTLINKLVEMGFVKRTADSKDKRVCHISLTTRGSSLRPIFMEITEILLDQMYQYITPIERDTLTKLLTKVNSYW